MSEYVVCDTEFKDKKVLIEALEEMGYKGKIEEFEDPTALVGYHGDQRAQKAHIVIRRKHVGSASNDIGFERTEAGTYKAWVSDYDKGVGLGRRIMKGELKHCYSKRMVLGTKVRGHRLKSVKDQPDGSCRIRITVS